MRPIRRTLPSLPAPTLAPPTAQPESFSRAPGQHEEIIDRVRGGFREVLRVLDDISKKHQDVIVKVELDTSVQKEILEVVKRIEEKLDTSGLSKEEEDKLAEALDAASNPLAEAIEANQPMGDNVVSKKKKKKGTK